MKKISFGIALILFGLYCFYVSVEADWAFVQILGLLIPVVGLAFAIIGFAEKGE